MENLRKLQECNKRNITFRQAFYRLEMTDADKALRELNEKEEFSALVNWALNKLPPFHSMDLKHKVNDAITDSMMKADVINLAKMQEGSFMSEQQLPELLNPEVKRRIE